MSTITLDDQLTVVDNIRMEYAKAINPGDGVDKTTLKLLKDMETGAIARKRLEQDANQHEDTTELAREMFAALSTAVPVGHGRVEVPVERNLDIEIPDYTPIAGETSTELVEASYEDIKG